MVVSELVAVHYEWIMKCAYRYCTNRMDAEDLAGETILKILSRKEKYDCTRPFKPWCCVIMLNTYITYYNHESLVRFDGEDVALKNGACNDVEQRINARNMLYTIEEIGVKSLSVGCVLLYAQGFSYEEISTRLNIPLGTVRSRISYGRRMIYKTLDY